MKTVHKVGAVGAGALTAGTIALSVAMFDHWEGRNYTSVHLPFDPPGVITVCGGITNYDIPKLKIGDKFTEAQCQKMISNLIPKYAAPLMRCIPSFTSMSEHRQAALVSFAINLGPRRVCGTSIARDLNAGRVTKACNAMSQYVNANGHRLQALVTRRNDPVWGERPWCLMKDSPSKEELMPWWQRWARVLTFKA